MEEIELHSINTRFEHTRQRDAAVERHLLASISSVGIYDPVQVVSNREGTFFTGWFQALPVCSETWFYSDSSGEYR